MQSIANILCKSIELTGLKDQGYTAKSFRPMGATAVVEAGVDPKRVQQIGHWKNQECFEKHYVHAMPKEDKTQRILQ